VVFYRRFHPGSSRRRHVETEFYTAYTPISRRQARHAAAIFEFQTLIPELTALDVANASLYAAATAVAEAAMMAHIHTGRNEVVVSATCTRVRRVLRAFSEGRGIKVRKGTEPGPKTAGRDLQQPDFLGLLVDPRRRSRTALTRRAARHRCVDPISLAILSPPGEYGATSRSAKGSSWLSPSYGGPHVGFISCRRSWCGACRSLDRRLLTTSKDAAGLCCPSAREQHIRREKATSKHLHQSLALPLSRRALHDYMGPKAAPGG